MTYNFPWIFMRVSTCEDIQKCHPYKVADQYDYDDFEEYRKLFCNGSFICQSAECQSDKKWKNRNDNLGYNGKDYLLEFIKDTCDEL